MAGIPGEKPSTPGSVRIDNRKTMGDGECVEAGHLHTVLPVAASTMQHDHERRRPLQPVWPVHFVGPQGGAGGYFALCEPVPFPERTGVG